MTAMNKTISYTKVKLTLAAVMIIFLSAGCIEENFGITLPAPEGDEVFFGVRAGFEYSGKNTKTIYAGNGDINYYSDGGKNFESISWDYNKDRIQVYCPQSPINYAHYKVLEGEINEQKYSYLERTGDASIQWKNETDGHDFYAMYPSNEMFTGESASTLKSGVMMNKTTVTGTIPISQTPKSIRQVTKNGQVVYIGEPNMDFAYMVAKTTGVRKFNEQGDQQGVSLSFKPIVTAVQIEFSMPEGILVKPANIGEIYIEGNNIAGDFSADLASWETSNGYPTCRCTRGTNRISISTWQMDTNGNRVPLTLSSGQSFIITVFLNPGTSVRDLRVIVSPTGGTGVGKTLSGLTLKSHLKTVITDLKLPAETITVENSKWSELIPEETPLKELSIPGTGNTFSYNHTNSAYKAQKEDFATQWSLGIRAFEITSDRQSTTFGGEYVKCNGQSMGVTIQQVFNDLKGLLNDNPDEFALVILNYQSEGADYPRDVTDYAKKVAAFYDSYTNTYRQETKDNKAEIFKLYSPELQLSDVRGKIMLIMRTNQEDEDPESDFQTVQKTIDTRNILAVNGCGSSKDKWRRRGYTVTNAQTPVRNIWDSDGNDFPEGTVLLEDYMVGTSTSENGTVTWRKDWNEVNIPANNYGGDFSYDCTTGDSDKTFKIWFQEWARVVPESQSSESYQTFYINRCRYSSTQSYVYYRVRWNGSYNEKLRHAQYAFSQAISGGEINGIPHVFINSLCGYFVSKSDKNSCTPWMPNPDTHDSHSEGIFGIGKGEALSWPTGGMSGDIGGLASQLNNDFYNYILNSGFEQATGPTGVVMIDMVSSNPEDGGSYYLPGVIIGNNFKYNLSNPNNTAGSATIEDWTSEWLN